MMPEAAVIIDLSLCLFSFALIFGPSWSDFHSITVVAADAFCIIGTASLFPIRNHSIL
jgi:hypothetical protein